jgi:hypothetical protein
MMMALLICLPFTCFSCLRPTGARNFATWSELAFTLRLHSACRDSFRAGENFSIVEVCAWEFRFNHCESRWNSALSDGALKSR